MNSPIRSTLRGVAMLASIAVVAMSVSVAHAMNIKKQNIVELLSNADSILTGIVSKKTDGFQNGLPYTEITLDVDRSVKGEHAATYTFRQFGLIEPKSTGDGRVNLMVTPAGWPTYAVGEQVLLFLHKRAPATGFQTTAGLTQGKFTVQGRQIANGTDNDSLFAGVKIKRGLSAAQQDLVNQPGGAYAVEEFLSLISTAVKENWIKNGVMTHED